MTDVSAVEPRPGSFKRREDSASEMKPNGGVEVVLTGPTSLPSLTPADVHRAESITPKQVDVDIRFDQSLEEEVKHGSFVVRGETPSRDALLEASSPSQVFNKTMVLPNLSTSDIQKADSIVPKKVASDISFQSAPQAKGTDDGGGTYKPGGFATKRQTYDDSDGANSVPTSPAQVFNKQFKDNLPLLSPRDEAQASNFVANKVSGDISFSFLGDAEEEMAYSKATKEELHHSLQQPNANTTNGQPNDAVVLDQKKTLTAFFGEPHAEKDEGSPRENNVTKRASDEQNPFDEINQPADVTGASRLDGVANGDSSWKDQPPGEASKSTQEVSKDKKESGGDDDDFLVDESIARLEQMLDIALDDGIADALGKASDGTEEEKDMQAQRKADLDAAFQEMAEQEKRLSESADAVGVVSDEPPVGEETRTSLMEFEALLDSAMSDDDFLESALSDDEFEINFSGSPKKNDTANLGAKADQKSATRSAAKTGSGSVSTKKKPTTSRSKTTTTRQRNVAARTSGTSRTKTQPQAKSAPRPARKPVSAPAARAVPRPAGKSKPKPVARPRPKPVTRPRAKPVSRPKPKLGTKPRPTGPTKPTVHSKPRPASTYSGGAKPRPSVGASKPKKTLMKKPSADDDDGAAPILTPLPSKLSGAMDQSMGDFAQGAISLPSRCITASDKSTQSKSKLLLSDPFSNEDSSGRIGSYLSPRRSLILKCKLKYQIDLHPTRGPCELCYYHLNAEDKAACDKAGHHIRVVSCRGGCARECGVFPRDDSENPVRLCRTCFFNTHRDSYNPKKFEYKKRLIF